MIRGANALALWRRYGPDALALDDLYDAWYVATFEGDDEASAAIIADIKARRP